MPIEINQDTPHLRQRLQSAQAASVPEASTAPVPEANRLRDRLALSRDYERNQAPQAPVEQQPISLSTDLPVGSNPDKATFNRLFDSYAEKYGIPPAILKSIALHESSWRQYDKNGDCLGGHNSTSTDWGVMQINDHAHPEAFPRAKTDLAYNIEYGAQYLAYQYKRYGNWRDAISAYNRGSVKREADGTYSNQQYVDAVLAHLNDYGGAKT